MTKIAFNLLGNEEWQAGYNYIINLLHALRMRNNHDDIFSLLLYNETIHIPDDLKYLVHETIAFSPYQRWSMSWVVDQMSKRVFRYDLLRNRLLKEYQIDIIAFGEAPKGSKIPTLTWFPDFQHIYFPEMFSKEECQDRNQLFKLIAKDSIRILLLSKSVRHDFEVFAPEHLHKTRVLNPVSFIPSLVYETDPQSITDHYNLPSKFIYLPNQLWKHKNHISIFHALKILNHRRLNVFLVCSGNLTDYRHPSYLSELLQQISCLGIRQQIAILGLIPRKHVFQLMRQSICVLNPSLFEGYGMTVDEARSLGKQVLISDIPAHHDQNHPRCEFFDPKNYEELADKIELIWSIKSPGPDLDLEIQARQELPERIRKFAESFITITQEVVF